MARDIRQQGTQANGECSGKILKSAPVTTSATGSVWGWGVPASESSKLSIDSQSLSPTFGQPPLCGVQIFPISARIGLIIHHGKRRF